MRWIVLRLHIAGLSDILYLCLLQKYLCAIRRFKVNLRFIEATEHGETTFPFLVLFFICVHYRERIAIRVMRTETARPMQTEATETKQLTLRTEERSPRCYGHSSGFDAPGSVGAPSDGCSAFLRTYDA